MKVEAIFSLVAFFLCVQCHLYTDSNVNPGFKQKCKDDTCVTDERPCFIPREKGILTRLDGVKVSNCIMGCFPTSFLAVAVHSST